MGRKKLEDQSKVKKRFVGAWLSESEYDWIHNKANVSKFIRNKILADMYTKEAKEEEDNS